MPKITAVIPVRAGSRRLPNKNILPFGNSNLLVHKIRQLKQVKQISNIIVSTDSDTMIQMAIDENVEFQRRPLEYCDEKTKTFNEVVEYVAKNLKTDIIMWSPCVCPIISPEMYSKAINEFLQLDTKYDSVISARLLKEYIFNNNGPVNFYSQNHVPSQQLPNWYIITNGFYIAQRSDMEKWKYFYGRNPKLIEISKFEAIDIDDIADFEFAEFIYNKLILKR